MTIIDKLKAEQEAQETERLAALIHAELEAVYARLDMARRTFRLSDNESDALLLGAFDQFVASLAVDAGSTKEEFLRAMGEAFDDMKEEEEPEETADDTEEEAQPS